MKFTISYKFKLKMAQNLSGRSSTGRCRSGAASASSAGAGAADRPQETL